MQLLNSSDFSETPVKYENVFAEPYAALPDISSEGPKVATHHWMVFITSLASSHHQLGTEAMRFGAQPGNSTVLFFLVIITLIFSTDKCSVLAQLKRPFRAANRRLPRSISDLGGHQMATGCDRPSPGHSATSCSEARNLKKRKKE